MNLIERVKNISFNPSKEWEVIAPETTTAGELYKRYIIPLAAIGPVASLVGISAFGISVPFIGGSYRMPLTHLLSMQLTNYVVALLSVFLLSLLVNALSPSFGGQKSPVQALKLAAYAYTPAWIAGALLLLPSFGMLALLAGLYGLYLFYLGATPLLNVPKDKAVGFTAVTVICAFVLTIVGSVITGALVGTGMSAMMTASRAVPESDALPDGLKKFAKQMEAVQKTAEATAQTVSATAPDKEASTQSDTPAPVAAVHQDKLRALLPETVLGFAREKIEASKVGIGDLMVSQAEATYRDKAENRSVDIAISDMAAQPLIGLAGVWGALEQETDNNESYTKTGKINGRPTHLAMQKDGSSSEYSVVVAERFLVTIHGHSVGLDALKTVAAAIPDAKLEAMKGDGAKR
jgi:hypothetical protein